MKSLNLSSQGVIAALSVASLALYLYPKDSIAQQAVIGGYGCGTGCAVSVKQLSSPERIGNGWSRVLVSETTRYYGPDGRETSFRGIPSGQSIKFWQFAKCDGSIVGWGYKSDGSDARTESIYDEEGRRIIYNAGGQRYSKWEALCNSPH
jgi:hypothetical protein